MTQGISLSLFWFSGNIVFVSVRAAVVEGSKGKRGKSGKEEERREVHTWLRKTFDWGVSFFVYVLVYV